LYVKEPAASVTTVSQPGVNEPSPLTMLPSGRITGTSYDVEGENPLPSTTTVSPGW
jgi:hypothetical protein